MKNTIVISAYHCCGKTYAYENNKDENFIILDTHIGAFNWKKRVRTNEELDKAVEFYESTPHMMSSDAFRERLKKQKIIVPDPDFPNNYFQYIKDNIGKVDVIFVSYELVVREGMEKAGIDFITVYPKKDLFNEWVGRMYLNDMNDSLIKKQCEFWASQIATDSILSEPHGKLIYRLGSNEYIDIPLLLDKYGNK